MGQFRPIDQTACLTFESVVITAAVTAGMALKSATGGVSAAGDGEKVVGFAAADAAVGAPISCWGLAGGIFAGIVANTVDLALEQKVVMNATQELDAGTVTNPVVGRVVSFNPAAGDGATIEAEFRFDPHGNEVI